jgi:hypothetical protein
MGAGSLWEPVLCGSGFYPRKGPDKRHITKTPTHPCVATARSIMNSRKLIHRP